MQVVLYNGLKTVVVVAAAASVQGKHTSKLQQAINSLFSWFLMTSQLECPLLEFSNSNKLLQTSQQVDA